MQTSNIATEDLHLGGTMNRSNGEDALKFSELALIFQRFELEMVTRELQVEQPLALLTRYLQQWSKPNELMNDRPDLSESLFIISGFSAFSTQEQSVLKELMKHGHVVVDLLLDHGYPQELPSPLDLFYESGRSYHQLFLDARTENVAIYLDQKLSPSEAQQVTPEKAAAYNEVESFWRKTQNQLHYQQQQSVSPYLEMWKVGNPEEEVRQMAAKIRALISEQKEQTALSRHSSLDTATRDLPSIYSNDF